VTLTSCVSLGSVPVFFSFFHVLYYPHHNRKAQRLYSFLVGFLAISIEIWLHLDRLISIEDVPVLATVVLRGGAKAKSFWSMKMCVFPIFFFHLTGQQQQQLAPCRFSLEVTQTKALNLSDSKDRKDGLIALVYDLTCGILSTWRNSTHAYRQVTRRGRGVGSRGRSRGAAGYGSRAGRSRGAARSPRRPPPPRRRSRGNARAPGTSPPRVPARRKPPPGTSPSSSAAFLGC
jgi:hypothetical protein